MHCNRRVRVQLGNARNRRLVPGLANIIGSKEKLGRKICDSHRGRIVECKALDAGQGDVFGDFDTEALESDDEHVRSAHALHGLVSQHIELSAVERFVDLIVADDGLVDLHPGDQVDFGQLLALRSATSSWLVGVLFRKGSVWLANLRKAIVA